MKDRESLGMPADIAAIIVVPPPLVGQACRVACPFPLTLVNLVSVADDSKSRRIDSTTCRRPPPLLRHSQPLTTPDRIRYTKRDSRGAERKPSVWWVREVSRVLSYLNLRAASFSSQDSTYKFNPRQVQQASFEFMPMRLPALSFRFLYRPYAAPACPGHSPPVIWSFGVPSSAEKPVAPPINGYLPNR